MKFKRNSKISPSINAETLANYHKNVSEKKLICKAAFTSLYFHPNGEVGACCLNKSQYFYGNYPQNNIEDIIKSIPRKLHQKYLSYNNFSLGCSACEQNIISGNFEGLMARIYSAFKLKNGIQRIDFELSNNCNLDCIMCERDKSCQTNEIYSEDFVKEITPYLRNIKFANFIGGEPFLIKEYYILWELILKLNPSCTIYVQTNGTIYNEKIKELIKHKNFHIGISLDSVNKNTLEKIRLGVDFEKLMLNFSLFKDSEHNKRSSLQISICPLRINKNEIPEILSFANKNQCRIFFNLVENPDNVSLKQLPSKNLKVLTENYDLFLSDFKPLSDIEERNLSSFRELNLLLKSWYKHSLSRESESILVEQSIIIQLLRNSIVDSFPEIYNKLEASLPKEWYISQTQFNKIMSADFKTLIIELMEKGKNENEIIKSAVRYFELFRIENISYE